MADEGLGRGVDPEILKRRTKEYALAMARLAASLPNAKAANIMGN